MLVSQCWDELDQSLRELRSTRAPVRYVGNQGNAGDALIAAAAFQVFDDLGLEWRPSALRDVGPNDVAIYGGGGNLVPEYQSCARFLERCLDVGARRVIVLPQSVRGHDDLLRRLDERFLLFCREKDSLQRVRGSSCPARVGYAPDLALRLDVGRLRARCLGSGQRLQLAFELLSRGKVLDYWRYRSHLASLPVSPAVPITVQRGDIERAAAPPRDARWDISAFYGSKLQSRAECEHVALALLDFVAKASLVVTDRLHVGIAALLVGRPIEFGDNSYGKIRAIYDAWLAKVPGVRWATSAEREGGLRRATAQPRVVREVPNGA